MILNWMLYCALVATLLGVAAAGMESVVRQRAFQVRWLWLGALVGSVVLPAIAYLFDAWNEARALSSGAQPTGEGVAIAGGWLADPFAGVPAPSFDLDPWLLAAWAIGSAIALVSLGVSYLGLRRRSRVWARRRIDGHDVWISPDTGPAVIGLVRSRIVLPEWVLEGSPTDRAMVLMHESEHLRARDPQLLVGSLLLAALLPWNIALWWQWRRLRQAIELDCDLRVLGAGLDRRSYGRLLVDVTERGTARRMAVVALSESRSSLERRLHLMFNPKSPGWVLRTAGGASLAIASVVVACTADIPSGPGAGPSANAVAVPSRVQGAVYEIAELDVKPQLSNASEIMEIMERTYPRLLQAAGIGGTVTLKFVIKPDGTADAGSIEVLESPNDELTAATRIAVQAFRFRPGQRGGEPVNALIQMPVTWQPSSGRPAPAAVPTQGGVPSEVTAALASVRTSRAALARTIPPQPSQGEPVFAYELAELDTRPRLINAATLTAVMDSLYPPLLKAAGIGGTVTVQFVIRPDGTVEKPSMKVLETPHTDFGSATLLALERFRFQPGIFRGQPVRVLIQMPVTWQPR